ncbi:hypothetical protein OH77DRAFT_1439277 [Trametes cingulata]|nr:hypothetical protein OH77DRAFT_1439277 [Trametes cingulata]
MDGSLYSSMRTRVGAQLAVPKRTNARMRSWLVLGILIAGHFIGSSASSQGGTDRAPEARRACNASPQTLVNEKRIYSWRIRYPGYAPNIYPSTSLIEPGSGRRAAARSAPGGRACAGELILSLTGIPLSSWRDPPLVAAALLWRRRGNSTGHVPTADPGKGKAGRAQSGKPHIRVGTGPQCEQQREQREKGRLGLVGAVHYALMAGSEQPSLRKRAEAPAVGAPGCRIWKVGKIGGGVEESDCGRCVSDGGTKVWVGRWLAGVSDRRKRMGGAMRSDEMGDRDRGGNNVRWGCCTCEEHGGLYAARFEEGMMGKGTDDLQRVSMTNELRRALDVAAGLRATASVGCCCCCWCIHSPEERVLQWRRLYWERRRNTEGACLCCPVTREASMPESKTRTRRRCSGWTSVKPQLADTARAYGADGSCVRTGVVLRGFCWRDDQEDVNIRPSSGCLQGSSISGASFDRAYNALALGRETEAVHSLCCDVELSVSFTGTLR